jgi:hypothetical protein
MSSLAEVMPAPHANDNAKPKKPRFEIVRFDDVNQTLSKDYVVQGFLGAAEFSLLVAKPGTAKSVLAGDIGCHIASGMDWHGRKVKNGLVVFFAGERKDLTERRIAAWAKQHSDVTGIPFVIVSGPLDLTAGVFDAQALAKTIAELAAEYEMPCRLVILDTVTRLFGLGDQNSSKDMGRFVRSVDELTQATGAHVAAIHHSGWAGDRGKGAIDLDGAIDVSFGIEVIGTGPTKVFTLKNTGANDGLEGTITAFRLESVDLGSDADGNVTSAPVVVQADASKQNGSNLKGNTAKALDALKRAIQAHGECLPDRSPGFEDNVPTVTRDQWREEFYAMTRIKEPKIAQGTLTQRFTRAIADLIETDQVGATGERCWVAIH